MWEAMDELEPHGRRAEDSLRLLAPAGLGCTSVWSLLSFGGGPINLFMYDRAFYHSSCWMESTVDKEAMRLSKDGSSVILPRFTFMSISKRV